MMTVMARISSTTTSEKDEATTENASQCPLLIGKKLACKFQSEGPEEEAAPDFHEEIIAIMTQCKSKKQIEQIARTFSHETLDLNSVRSVAFTFANLFQLAAESGDYNALTDVQTAFYLTVERFREEKGDMEANRLISLCDYAKAGVVLGYDRSVARRDNDMNFAESIEKRAADIDRNLCDANDFREIFNYAYNRFSNNA